jgi:hypothetical protein
MPESVNRRTAEGWQLQGTIHGSGRPRGGRHLSAGVVAALAVLFAACGDGGEADTAASDAATQATEPAPSVADDTPTETYELLANAGSVEIGSVPSDLAEVTQTDGAAPTDDPVDAIVFQNELEPQDAEGFRQLVVSVLPREGYDEVAEQAAAAGETSSIDVGLGRTGAVREVISGELSIEIPYDDVVLFVNGLGLSQAELEAVARSTELQG